LALQCGGDDPTHRVWAKDFQFDATADGRRLKFLNVIDAHSRLCLAIRDEFLTTELFATVTKVLDLATTNEGGHVSTMLDWW
jgi:hypothetical protein